jgi:hypothetical protein
VNAHRCFYCTGTYPEVEMVYNVVWKCRWCCKALDLMFSRDLSIGVSLISKYLYEHEHMSNALSHVEQVLRPEEVPNNVSFSPEWLKKYVNKWKQCLHCPCAKEGLKCCFCDDHFPHINKGKGHD